MKKLLLTGFLLMAALSLTLPANAGYRGRSFGAGFGGGLVGGLVGSALFAPRNYSYGYSPYYGYGYSPYGSYYY